jgi:hypothetical protein
MNQEQADAVKRLLHAEVAAEGKRSFRQGLLANGLFFIAGGGLTVTITLLVHPLK